MTDHPVLTIDEVAELLRCSKTTAYRMAVRGEIPSFRLGVKRVGTRPQYRFMRAELLKYMQDHYGNSRS